MKPSGISAGDGGATIGAAIGKGCGTLCMIELLLNVSPVLLHRQPLQLGVLSAARARIESPRPRCRNGAQVTADRTGNVVAHDT
jgi:hypothetical protein